MSFSENSSESSDSFRKKPKDKPIPIISKTDKKYYKQKFCESWVDRFKPWLTRVQGSPDKAYCKACKTLVKAKKYHIQRHGHTSKHYSNLQKYLAENGLPPISIKQNLGQRKERKKEAENVKEPTPEVSVPFENVFMDDDCQDEVELIFVDNPTSFNENINPNQNQTTDDVRKNLLLQIQKDNQDLVSTFCGLFPTVPVEKKDHVDSFLDSVGLSIKVLPAKLISEAKVRIANLLCELELRAITDLEPAHPEASNSAKKKPDAEKSFHEQDINDRSNKRTEMQKDTTKRKTRNQQMPKPKTNVRSLIHEQLSTPPNKKDHIESFCDSIASSIKVLPRKIISEAKMRISELLCELELRAEEMYLNYQQSEKNI